MHRAPFTTTLTFDDDASLSAAIASARNAAATSFAPRFAHALFTHTVISAAAAVDELVAETAAP
jgi:hypothetical protein